MTPSIIIPRVATAFILHWQAINIELLVSGVGKNQPKSNIYLPYSSPVNVEAKFSTFLLS